MPVIIIWSKNIHIGNWSRTDSRSTNLFSFHPLHLQWVQWLQKLHHILDKPLIASTGLAIRRMFTSRLWGPGLVQASLQGCGLNPWQLQSCMESGWAASHMALPSQQNLRWATPLLICQSSQTPAAAGDLSRLPRSAPTYSKSEHERLALQEVFPIPLPILWIPTYL